MDTNRNILISGASFAGLTSAYWMHQMGYEVTVVEIGNTIKRGGTPVDIKDGTIEIIKRMGLYEALKSQSLRLAKWEFKSADDVTHKTIHLHPDPNETPADEFEIERDTLLQMLYDLVKDKVSFVFDNSIASLCEGEHGVQVTFKDAKTETFDLVIGCDGIHSSVRRLWFGNESEYSHYLGYYFSIAIVNKLLIEANTMQLYAEPNKSFMLNTYNGKTDLVFIFGADREIPYDYRNQKQLKQITYDQMEGMKWRVGDLREELINSQNFYFDKLCQIKMPHWSKGRVVLVGDAGYCASPAAGMGGSLAIMGATYLADAFAQNQEDHMLAFEAYEKALRPFVETIQAQAIETLQNLIPKTEQEVWDRLQYGFVQP